MEKHTEPGLPRERQDRHSGSGWALVLGWLLWAQGPRGSFVFSIVLPTPDPGLFPSTQHCGDWPCRAAMINQGRFCSTGHMW